MKNIILLLLICFFFSCEEKKIEFVQSQIDSTLVLIKNPSENDLILKKEIINFIKHKKKKLQKEDNGLSFYEYTSGTSYFLKNANYVGQGVKTVIVFQNRDNFTSMVHELIHSIGVHHTFDNDSKYTFELRKTDNVMDYTHQIGKKRFTTNIWQWRILNKNI